jgi:hypothetical protein
LSTLANNELSRAPPARIERRIRSVSSKSQQQAAGTKMFAKTWDLIKDTVSGFMADEVEPGGGHRLFTIFSIAPLLLIRDCDRRPGVRA